jgi:hypothetical protein
MAVVIGTPVGAQAAQPPPFSAYPTLDATSAAADDAADALSGMVGAAPDQNTGVRITGPDEVTVTVPPGVDRGVRAAALQTALSTAGRAGGVRVTVATVRRSGKEIRKLKDSLVPLLTDPRYAGQIVGVGEDPSLGVAVVYATADSAAARTQIAATYGSAVIFRLSSQARADDADRDRDSTPHYGGSGFTWWNAAHTAHLNGWCSTGFPVIHGGVTYMLTAGHCVPGQRQYPALWASFNQTGGAPSNLFYFGGLFTTTVSGTELNPTSGTQDRFGDWSMIQGSTYSPHVYNCPNTTGSCSFLSVGAASWVSPAMNAGACSSGRTTGQVCRYRVTDPDITFNVDGRPTGQLALLRSNQDLAGGDDCLGWNHGDSGGAIYQAISGRTGFVRAMGLVTAHTGTTACNYYYTKLQGVRAWSPNASMPLL